MEWLLFMEKRYLTEMQHARNLGEFVIPGTRYKADGYIKSLNTVFEFHGDFWHGNPDLYDESEINPRVGITYGELYKQTITKSKLITDKGFNLIEVWENDWKKFINAIRIIQKKYRSTNNENS
jgi:G:T-mismatch repair DNA endonuclease (very short patch repair protein)